MSEKMTGSRPMRLMVSGWNRLPAWVRESWLTLSAVGLIFLAVLYWGLIASDRYVSEAHVIVDTTGSSSVSSEFDISAFIMGGATDRDLQLLRDYLLSMDMAEYIEAKFNLREHYSDSRRDLLSRLWSEDAPRERFYAHYLKRVSAKTEEGSGVLVISVQAYDPVMARDVTAELVRKGEAFINELAHALAREQVGFLESEVAKAGERLQASRNALLAFQDSKGYVSPQATLDGISSIINQIESELSKLRAERTALLGYLSPTAPDVVRLQLQISGLERQLRSERSRLASPGGSGLNSLAEQFQRLQMDAQFAQDIYQSTLVALEKGRVDATRMMKKVSVLQRPAVADSALEPRRLYNITIFSLVVMLLAGIASLLVAIIRDHKD